MHENVRKSGGPSPGVAKPLGPHQSRSLQESLTTAFPAEELSGARAGVGDANDGQEQTLPGSRMRGQLGGPRTHSLGESGNPGHSSCGLAPPCAVSSSLFSRWWFYPSLLFQGCGRGFNSPLMTRGWSRRNPKRSESAAHLVWDSYSLPVVSAVWGKRVWTGFWCHMGPGTNSGCAHRQHGLYSERRPLTSARKRDLRQVLSKSWVI